MRCNVALPFLAAFCLASVSVTAQSPSELRVTGDATALRITSADLAKMPRQVADAKQEDGTAVHYEGVLLREVLTRAAVPADKDLRGKTLTTYVLAKARDGYQIVFTLADLDSRYGGQPILIADRRNGQPLDEKQGPFRLVCPGDTEGARSVKMLEELEVVRLKK
jgi:DMSO/TMAO reductase YedYZ molybdopterin-dependent catalytic subunit